MRVSLLGDNRPVWLSFVLVLLSVVLKRGIDKSPFWSLLRANGPDFSIAVRRGGVVASLATHGERKAENMHGSRIQNAHTTILRGVVIAATVALLTGCEDGGSSASGDIGDNDPNVAVALGDSITQGMGVTPYPALITSKQVVNAGTGGGRASGGASRVGGLLATYKPAYLFILLGSNDAIHGGAPGSVKASLGAVVSAARANQTIPVLATVPPMIASHATFNEGVRAINTEIRNLASETGTALVDLEGSFGSNPEGLLDAGGLHPNQQGQQVIASSFAGAL